MKEEENKQDQGALSSKAAAVGKRSKTVRPRAVTRNNLAKDLGVCGVFLEAGTFTFQVQNM
jgi:hypothetical protein